MQAGCVFFWGFPPVAASIRDSELTLDIALHDARVGKDQFPVATHASSIVLAIDPERGICGR